MQRCERDDDLGNRSHRWLEAFAQRIEIRQSAGVQFGINNLSEFRLTGPAETMAAGPAQASWAGPMRKVAASARRPQPRRRLLTDVNAA